MSFLPIKSVYCISPRARCALDSQPLALGYRRLSPRISSPEPQDFLPLLYLLPIYTQKRVQIFRSVHTFLPPPRRRSPRPVLRPHLPHQIRLMDVNRRSTNSKLLRRFRGAQPLKPERPQHPPLGRREQLHHPSSEVTSFVDWQAALIFYSFHISALQLYPARSSAPIRCCAPCHDTNPCTQPCPLGIKPVEQSAALAKQPKRHFLLNLLKVFHCKSHSSRSCHILRHQTNDTTVLLFEVIPRLVTFPT